MDIQRGMLVKSKAGHDKDGFFIVLGIDDNYALICDGKRRPLEKCKKKKIKHLSLTNTIFSEEMFMSNKSVKKVLSPYNNGNIN